MKKKNELSPEEIIRKLAEKLYDEANPFHRLGDFSSRSYETKKYWREKAQAETERQKK